MNVADEPFQVLDVGQFLNGGRFFAEGIRDVLILLVRLRQKKPSFRALSPPGAVDQERADFLICGLRLGLGRPASTSLSAWSQLSKSLSFGPPFASQIS